MIRVLLMILFMSMLHPMPSYAANEKDVKAAFIRDGNLWTFINSEEKQITQTGKVFGQPKWSKGGQWLLYQNEAPAERPVKNFSMKSGHIIFQQAKKRKYFMMAFPHPGHQRKMS